MSNKLVELLEAEGDRIVANASEYMNKERENAVREMRGKISDMMAALITTPIKGAAEVIELLEKGGIIKSQIFKVDYDESRVILSAADRTLYDAHSYKAIKINKGNYRFTLIIEPLEEQP